MRQFIRAAVIVSILALPTAAHAGEEPPTPDLISCPAAFYVDGVASIPYEAPADCLYPGAVPMPEGSIVCDPNRAVDEQPPCLLNTLLPPGCERPSDDPGATPCPIPVDASPCWISDDGSTNCARGDLPAERPLADYTISALLIDGVERRLDREGFLTFYEGRVSASVGCNTIGGPASLRDDGVIELGELFSTMMFCDGLMEDETALLSILRGDSLRIDVETLSSDAGAATISRRSDPPNEAEVTTGLPVWFFLALPLFVGLVGISIGLTSRRGLE